MLKTTIYKKNIFELENYQFKILKIVQIKN